MNPLASSSENGAADYFSRDSKNSAGSGAILVSNEAAVP
jgi:hypothetical protein